MVVQHTSPKNGHNVGSLFGKDPRLRKRIPNGPFLETTFLLELHGNRQGAALQAQSFSEVATLAQTKMEPM